MTRRRGRKRKADAARRPGGRINYGSKRERIEDMQRVVREARSRVYGLSKTDAAAMPETSALGRLVATGEISRRQYEAAALYSEIVRQHDFMLGTRGLPSAGDLERQAGHDNEDGSSAGYRARYRHAMARYDLCRGALRTALAEDPMAATVTDAVAIADWSLPDLTPSLRIGLNHLAQALGVPRGGGSIGLGVGAG